MLLEMQLRVLPTSAIPLLLMHISSTFQAHTCITHRRDCPGEHSARRHGHIQYTNVAMQKLRAAQFVKGSVAKITLQEHFHSLHD